MNICIFCVCAAVNEIQDVNILTRNIKKLIRICYSLKQRIFNFYKTKEDRIYFIFLNQFLNLSLYQSNRYDKNLSLIFIYAYEYLNVCIRLMRHIVGLWAPNIYKLIQLGPQKYKLGPQIFAGDLII